jgi:hypothetical protein
MSYTDDEELKEHIGESDIIELTDDEKAAVNTDTLEDAIVANPKIRGRIDRAIINAESQINALGRKHWEVPIRIDAGQPSTPANTPPLIGLLAGQLTLVKLFQRRAGSFTELPETVIDIRREANDMLKMVNSGHVDLGINPPPQRSTQVIATAEGEPKLFTQETMKDW